MKKLICLALVLSSLTAGADLRVSKDHIDFLATEIGGRVKFNHIQVISKSDRERRDIRMTARCDEAWDLNFDCVTDWGKLRMCSLWVKFKPTELGRQSCFVTIDETPGQVEYIDLRGWGVEQGYWD